MALDNIEKNGVSINWGGRREGSGRKPLMDKEQLERTKELISSHGMEEIEHLGKKKERTLHLLDVLFEEGLKGNIPAIKEYFDRQFGKPPQSLDMQVEDKRLIINDESSEN